MVKHYRFWIVFVSEVSRAVACQCSRVLFWRENVMRVSQGYWETREHGQFQLRNRGTKEKYLREQGNKKRFREHGNKTLRKGGQKKKRCKWHSSLDISFALMSSTFLSVNLFAWNCGSG